MKDVFLPGFGLAIVYNIELFLWNSCAESLNRNNVQLYAELFEPFGKLQMF